MAEKIFTKKVIQNWIDGLQSVKDYIEKVELKEDKKGRSQYVFTLKKAKVKLTN